MFRIILGFLLLISLAACGSEPKWAPEAEVKQAAYRHNGPASITLFTVISNRSGSGAHAGLMINGSQRILFDPAGTWYSPSIPERNDVHYGITPHVLSYYIDYHTRETFHTVMQTVVVSPDVAQAAIRAVQAYGAVPKAYCTKSITTVLKSLPGFKGIKTTFYPKAAMQQFSRIPGVKEHKVYDDDADDNSGLLQSQQKNRY
ncbi:MAG TPA: hypothetical protein DD729_06640 [Rhodobacteraceae bacterium]|jgi:hypothetical protein|nr:hypothetical protein [Paracoccaceae bacterium]